MDQKIIPAFLHPTLGVVFQLPVFYTRYSTGLP